MKQLSNSVLYLMSISAGLVVANLYYNQPLLHQIAVTFSVNESTVSNVALSTQVGYALGLLIIIPLGDKITNKKILQFDFLLMILSLIAAAMSNSLLLLIISSFFIGFTSAIPQLFVPMAAELSDDKGRGRAIGIVMSGLLIGILGSRVISGLVGAQFGWRVMYYAAAVLMFALFVLLQLKLPKIRRNYKGSYAVLMKSLWFYFKTESSLRLAALRGALAFAGLSAFWTTLVFLMEDSFGYGSGVTGAFGLFGILGALAATVIGKLNDKINKNRIILFSVILIILSWVVFLFSTTSLIGLIIGITLVDLGLQALHITNQNIIFSKNPEARNRVNTIYMVSFFIGGALGTTVGAFAWQHYQWIGVSLTGLLLSLSLLIVHLVYKRKTL
ncbi:MFS transporter [Salegentibacter salegens]|uniref:Predicted arabinose efflux permease, MFS family n=2 Tax=Salegentibacter salegens TaxID=143223 RepID=A0A1M7NPJ1_9FLAO|nr:MFS transporter [Salegentibacter salegens]PRX43086.1 putative MFS family arabinose efflux permease [Salegentibacter salegens]SHN05474.1 Predicted arabinose efflux permease, MFS family [Salegentibacter salegens]